MFGALGGLIGALLFVAGPLIGIEIARRRREGPIRRAARAMGGPIPPLNLRLVADPAPSTWAERRAERFERLGFERVGAFRQAGSTVQGVILLGRDGTVVAEILTGTAHGRVVTALRTTADGRVRAASTGPETPMPPWFRRVSLPGAGPERLLAELEALEPDGSPLQLTAGEYVEFTTRLYRRLVEWELLHGRCRSEMLPRLERISGMTAEPEAAEFLRRAHEAERTYPRG